MATIPDLERHLTPELRAQRQEMLDKRGLPTLGFYEQLMAYPELFERLQALGTLVRFQSVLPPRVREAIGAGRPLQRFGDGLEDVRAAVRCVVRQETLPQDVFDRLTSAFTVPGAVEVVALAAMYRMFASLGAAFESRMPDGTPPPPWVTPPSGSPVRRTGASNG